MPENMYDVFRETAQRQPEHPAILGPRAESALSYQQLDEAIVAASEKLRALGVQRGQCVGLHVPSSVDYIVLNYAVWRLGACVVPLAVELAPDEKRDVCRQIELAHVISPKRTAKFLDSLRTGEGGEISPDIGLYPIDSGCRHPAGFEQVNAAFIRFTSGTTGSSKGVVLSHESIDERISAANEALRVGPRDRVLWILSMSYHFTVSIVGYLTFGATVVLPGNHFAAGILEAVRRHGVTFIYASPMHFALLADSNDAAPLPTVRLAVSTTTSLDSRVADRFRERYGLPIAQALGIIEIGLPCINLEFAADRARGVGRPLPAYEVKLVEAGLHDGAQEIYFRGPGCLDAYYRPWRTRDEIMPGGWFRTGDVGTLDDAGCLVLRGRSSDVINVMGMKFFPDEVERVLSAHPQVAAVAVYARRDDRLGEAPCARVVLKAGEAGAELEEELRQHCKEHLASYKVPERIEFVADLPRTASGKILHRAG